MAINVVVEYGSNNTRCVPLKPQYQGGWKNKEGTSDMKPHVGDSWKDYWEVYTRQPWPKKCSVFCCDGEAEVGAHVINPALSRRDFIVPMCRGCNARYGEYDPDSMILEDDTILVDANLR